MINIEPAPHLGGHLHKTHTDDGTLVYLQTHFGIKSMLDIGCGTGGMQDIAKAHNILWFGVDGDNTLKPNDYVLLHDFTTDAFLRSKISQGSSPIAIGEIRDITIGELGDEAVNLNEVESIDLAWSVEFLEHVEEKYMRNYMEAFTLCKYVIITAAPPNYPGHHHVNCKLSDYWIGAFAANGFEYDHKISMEVRNVSTMKKPFMQRTGMFFKRHL